MNGRRLVCCVGLFGVLAACSGTYNVGTMGNEAGTSSAGASGAANPGTGGALAAAGAIMSNAGSGASISYCGLPLSDEPITELAPPEVVAERVQRFLLATSVPETNLPSPTTREWASGYALDVLDSVSSASTPGMRRFVSSWWPGNENENLWASYFTSRHGSLSDLLQSEQLLEHGAGVLTDPVVLQHESISSRGAFVYANLLCTDVPPPPPNLPAAGPPPPGVTRREFLASQLTPPPCAGCHRLIDPPGLALEHFAADGSYLTTDAGKPIDSSSSFDVLQGGEPSTISFSDIHDFGGQASNHCAVISCFARKLLQDAQQSAALPGGDPTDAEVAGLARAIDIANGDLRQALKAVVESDRFLRPE